MSDEIRISCKGSPEYDNDMKSFYVEPESLEQRMFPNIVVADIKPFKNRCSNNFY
jgi:hypothetical protein